MKRTASLVLAIALLFLSSPVYAVTWQVPSQCPTIQAGIDSASAGDTVLVACGTYYEHDVAMKSGICLRSTTGQADCVTINAQDSGRVMNCSRVGSTSRIEGITFVDGSGSSGAGVECSFSSPTFNQCVFESNSVSSGGGGMCCRDSSSVTLINCTFTSNTAGNDGGGMYCFNYSNPTLENCIFTGNTGPRGTGIYTHTGCTLTATDCSFTDNTASSSGGGIYSYSCPPAVITDCIFSGNSASSNGGAMYFYLCSPQITGCTVFGSSAGGMGAGICLNNASASVANTIIASSTDGDAIYVYTSGTVTMSCCDVYDNVDGDWTGPIAGQGTINGNMSEDPEFCNPPAGDLGLGPDSDCLAANNTCGVLIGAVGESCSAGIVARTEKSSWSGIKAVYR